MLKIRDYLLRVDIENELRAFEWENERIISNKLNACSPFRKERRPSFAVNLDNGLWVDKGSTSDEWRKGGFVKLLSFLRQETLEETEDYLIKAYAPNYSEIDKLALTVNLAPPVTSDIKIDESRLIPLRFRHSYLSKRGIDEATQRLFNVGFDKELKAVSMPIYNAKGELVNIKFRSVNAKKFWYLPDGDKITKHLYGLHIVKRRNIKEICITESEIDTMYLWANGIPSVSLGSASMSKEQERLLLRSGVERIHIATDNDEAGEHVAAQIRQRLEGYMLCSRITFPEGVKDVNEINFNELHKYINADKKAPLLLL